MFNITPKTQVEINEYLPVLQSLGERRTFKKGGVVKSYYLSNGKEVILRLMSKNSAAFGYSSFITGAPSQETIECVQACEGVWISLKELDDKKQEYPWLYVMRVYMAEQHYLSMERRLIMLHHKSLEQRYR